MPLKLRKITLWTTELEDRPGAAAEKLDILADAGANLEYAVADRCPSQPGRASLAVSPLSGKRLTERAQAAGFAPSVDQACLRVEGTNRPGLGAKLTGALAKEGINLKSLAAATIGNRFALYLVFDHATIAEAGFKIIKKLQ